MQGTPDRAWSDGYNTQAEYMAGCYRELAPSHIRLALLSRGVRPPPIDRPFTYLELGCGQGLSTNLLAGAYPQGHFLGVDFMPAHIVNARLLAEEAGLANVTFHDDSFAELLQRDLPEMDFIAMHGVLSWVGPAIRQDALNVVRALLKPGGAFYVSYNTLPGWAPSSPMRWLLRELTASGTGMLESRVTQALDFIAKLEPAGAHYFRMYPKLKQHLEKISQQNPRYLIHEYLNDHWDSFYFKEAAELMGTAKLGFAASATLAENIEALSIPVGMKELMAKVGDPLLAETLKDFAINQRFRRDIYVRGRISLTRPEVFEAYESTPFGLIIDRSACEPTPATPIGKYELKPAHGIILDLLAAGPTTIGALKADPRLAQLSKAELLSMTALLCAVGYAAAGPPGHVGTPLESARNLNTALLNRTVRGQPSGWLTSPQLGNFIPVDTIEQLLLWIETSSAANPIETVCRKLAVANVRPLVDGKPLAGAELAGHLAQVQPTFRTTRLPWLKAMGAA